MAKPQTIIRAGSDSSTVSYVLPPGVYQYIESVLVQVDNGAIVDVKPELSIATVNGVVMATKEQGRGIPHGDVGAATWALRLDDETEEAAVGLPYVFGSFTNINAPVINPVVSGVATQLPFNGVFTNHDPDVFGVTGSIGGVPATLQIKVAGVYLTFLSAEWTTGGFAAFVSGGPEDNGGWFQQGRQTHEVVDATGHGTQDASVAVRTSAYGGLSLVVTQTSGVNKTVSLGTLKVIKLA